MTRRKIVKPRTADEAFAFATKHALPCMNILPPLFEDDPIRTIVCFSMGVTGWSLLMERALTRVALEQAEQCKSQSACSL